MQVVVVDVVQVAVTVAMVDQVAVMDELEPVEAMAEKVFIQEVHIYLHRVKDMMVQIMAGVDLVVLAQIVEKVEQAQFLLSQELQ